MGDIVKPKDDGRPAFPRAGEGEHILVDESGMTLRQWYAGQALSGLLAHHGGAGQFITIREAVVFADALIAELDKKEDA